MPVTLRANAKVNLHLDIGPKRKDGYHELKTLFQEISLHDTLTFTPTAGEIELSASPSHVPQGRDNIVVKALEMLRKKLKTKKGMRVQLEKQIPMGAGLGGGSSDAAAALKAGWTLWRNSGARKIQPFRKIPPTLSACAKKLGADVSFFLLGGTAWAEGVGEKLKPVPPEPSRWLVLIYPRVHVSTAEAYRLLDKHVKKKSPPLIPRFNSFEPVILKKYPAVAEAHQALLGFGCTDVLMSGSGSTVFGFVKDAAEGSQIFNQLQNRPWDVFLAQTIVT